MNGSKNEKVELEDFIDYLLLILGAIKKVHPVATDNLLTKRDMEILFYKISKNKKYFVYDDFEYIYHKKPELISWIDYFKNNDEDILFSLNRNIKKLTKISIAFFEIFSFKIDGNIFDLIQDDIFLKDLMNEIDNLCIKIDKEKKKIDELYGFDLKRILHIREPNSPFLKFKNDQKNNNTNSCNFINPKEIKLDNYKNIFINSDFIQKSENENLNQENFKQSNKFGKNNFCNIFQTKI